MTNQRVAIVGCRTGSPKTETLTLIQVPYDTYRQAMDNDEKNDRCASAFLGRQRDCPLRVLQRFGSKYTERSGAPVRIGAARMA